MSERKDHMQATGHDDDDLPASASFGKERRGGRRITLGVATIVVVSLVAALLISHTFPQAGPTPGYLPGTPVVTPTPAPRWTAIQGLLNTHALPILAPNNPQVVYEVAAPSIGQFQFQRSDDAGATWQLLPMPSGLDSSSPKQPSVFVSPFDAHTVFLTLPSSLSAFPQQCPLAQGLGPLTSFSGGMPCSIQFYSKDGGGHWSLIQLPQRGSLGSTETFAVEGGIINPSVLRPQGNRLYSFLGHTNQGGLLFDNSSGRLVTSTDGGITWRMADTVLAQQGYTICDYAPTPTGSTVFALAQKGTCDVQSKTLEQLWRTADAGNHWAQVGPGPSNTFMHLFATIPANAAQPALYLVGPSKSPGVQISTDGGKTWQVATSQGILFAQGSLPVVSTVLPDGSLMIGAATPYPDQKFLFLAWKPGDAAWRQVAPPRNDPPMSLLVGLPDASGQAALWVVIVKGLRGEPSTYDVEKAALT